MKLQIGINTNDFLNNLAPVTITTEADSSLEIKFKVDIYTSEKEINKIAIKLLKGILKELQ